LNHIIERIKTKRHVLIGLTIALLVLTLPVVILVDDFVRDVILVPFAYYLWLGDIIIKALPQNCFLTPFIFLSIAIAIPSLRKGHRTIWRAKESSETVEGQVALWEKRLRLLTSGSYSDNRFAYHLGRLVVQILAYEERLTTRATINELENGAFSMPIQVRQYVLAGIGTGIAQKRRSLMQSIKLWWKKLFTPKHNMQTPKQYEDIIAVLQYIEEQLKITETQNPMRSKTPETSQTEVNYVK